jgi:hypothetical protein
MPSAFQMSYENLKHQTKTPIWTFGGLALVAVLIVVGVISEKNKNEKNAKFILSPQIGDIFEIKTDDNQYTLYKVDEVQGDSVFIRINQYETNKATGLADLKRKGEGAYSEDVFAVDKKQLKAMFDKDKILDIDRK